MRCKITYPICFIQAGYVFYPSFVVVILMGEDTTGLRPGMRTAAAPLAIDWRRRHAPPV